MMDTEPNGVSKKKSIEIFRIDDAMKVACHVDQNERHPGDAGNRRDRRGDAQT